MNKHTILIVDDTEPNRIVLSGYIDALGFASSSAENGRVALEQMAAAPPDLVLLDILMPEVDGFETLHRMKTDAQLRDIPVLVISALDDMDSIIRCIEQGADDYLVKPFNPTLLRARISACLRKKEYHDAEQNYARQLARANEQIQLQNDELREANALKDKFLQIASHDIRNPLTIMGTALHVARQMIQRGETSAEKLDEYFRMMTTASERIQSIVSDFLDYRKIQSGSVELKLSPIDMDALLRQLVMDNQLTADQKGINLVLSIPEGLRPALGDAARTSQVATNYISNALKFSPRGSTVAVKASEEDGQIRVIVQDQGPGIPVEERGFLFREFAAISTRPTGDEKSTGLGLSIVKRLTQSQGGNVGAEFPETGGSMFWFSLPEASVAATVVDL